MRQPARDLSIDVGAVTAACRLTLSPDDARALADLRERAGRMDAVDGETPARQAFRLAAQVCGADPSLAHVDALCAAMNAFNRADLLRACPQTHSNDAPFRTGGNGVAAAVPREADNDL